MKQTPEELAFAYGHSLQRKILALFGAAALLIGIGSFCFFLPSNLIAEAVLFAAVLFGIAAYGAWHIYKKGLASFRCPICAGPTEEESIHDEGMIRMYCSRCSVRWPIGIGRD
jgi:hypothetical protein